MKAAREAIWSALFAKLQTVSGIVTFSRRLKLWSDVAIADQPALFLTERYEDVNVAPHMAVNRPGLNSLSVITADCYLYANTDTDPSIAPSTILNPLVDAVFAALAPDNVVSNKQTLGGLVSHCWIEGRITTDEGVLHPQGVVIIPILMKAA